VLGQRIATAIVLLAILLPAITVFPPVVWDLVSLGFLCAAAWEWARLLNRGSHALALGAGTAALGGAMLLWRAGHPWPEPLVFAGAGAASVFWIFAGPLRLWRHDATAGGLWVAGGLLLACWISLVELREVGVWMLLSSLAVVWVADIAAYFVGRLMGRHKLAPRISPGKTWEGAFGGIAAVVLVAALVATFATSRPQLAETLPALLFDALGPLGAGLALAGLAALSIVGDLHESLLKRQAQVKDSSSLLPGHGGVLDRIDALLPVMPAALLLYRILS
jgi:phosphatidate cytidylyltransferase